MTIHLLPSSSRVAPADLHRDFPDGVTACDFYVLGAEAGEDVPGGYRLGPVLNVDHHAPTPRMSRLVSSTNLAIDCVTEARPSAPIVINHTDCDSVLSAGIVAGRLDPDPEYGTAALAADHTGEEHAVADLLQSLDHLRDLDLSFDSLRRRLAGTSIAPPAEDALRRRRRKREAAAHAVAGSLITIADGLAFGVLEQPIDSEFFPVLVPEAALILLASRRSRDAPWAMKLRLGMAAPKGLTLHSLRLHELDTAYGGRWNAGSNARGGGTRMPPEQYAEAVVKRLAEMRAAVTGR
jgi:hypothetical protein